MGGVEGGRRNSRGTGDIDEGGRGRGGGVENMHNNMMKEVTLRKK